MPVQISVNGPDRLGLIAALAGRLFDLGFNLGDTNFAVLGTGFEFSTVADLPQAVEASAIAAALREVPELDGCEIEVRDFAHEPLHRDTGRATHRVVFRGGDQPGLLARMAEAILEFDANIVRLNAQRTSGAGGHQYSTSCDIAVPPQRATACLAALANTAGQLQLTCEWHEL